MPTRALDAGVPAGWVAADEFYGHYAALRLTLEERGMLNRPRFCSGAVMPAAVAARR